MVHLSALGIHYKNVSRCAPAPVFGGACVISAAWSDPRLPQASMRTFRRAGLATTMKAQTSYASL
jgi:hypothetical protein